MLLMLPCGYYFAFDSSIIEFEDVRAGSALGI